jgi:signal transduction histidine kinase/DNA-binding response OmpR family regulator
VNATAGDRVSILLVDDQPARLLSYGAILGSLRLDLVEARSGREALQRLMEREFAAILLDVNMPDMDGFETAAMIHRHPRFEKTPIIFVTAVHVTDLDQLRGYELGAFDYVYVPVVPEILRNKVQVLAELHAQRKKLERLNRTLEQANVELANAHSSLQAQRARELEALNRTLEKANLELAEANAALETENIERRRAEESGQSLNRSLMRRVEEVETLIDLVPVGIAIADDPRCDTIRVNSTLADLLQISPATNASMTASPGEQPGFRLRRGGADIPPDELPMHACAARGVPVDGVEIEVHRPDGTTRVVMMHARPLFDESDRVRGCIGVCVDLTERIQIEESLREGDRRKDEFLATLSHELRNPLAAIANAAQFMRLAAPTDPGVGPSLDVLGRQVGHLIRLIDDLLDVSRITRGKITLRPERVDLVDVVARALETARPLAAERGQRLETALPDCPLLLDGDPVRLAQVAVNLLANAVKYTEEGGRIELAVGWTEGSDGREQAILRVTDTGIGIADEMLPTVFDLFAQADHPPGRQEGGLGIGLALVRELVGLHGGTVEASSPGPGQGAEFVVRLPLAVRPVVEARPADTAADARRRPSVPARRVLLVDDNQDSAESLAALLRVLGHDVSAAYDGRGAIAAARLDRPDLILLDIGMPDMSGYEVARLLRAEPGLDATTLIALTGYGSDDDRRKSRAAGFDGHLVKPIDFEDLERLLGSLQRALPPERSQAA